MFKWFRKRKVRCVKSGIVVSMRSGESRSRISVESGDMTRNYFVLRLNVKVGQQIKAGKVLGWFS